MPHLRSTTAHTGYETNPVTTISANADVRVAAASVLSVPAPPFLGCDSGARLSRLSPSRVAHVDTLVL
eukprot:m.980587 g.980587  ORF g.980587 m.980587 type:complete len:68 (-) comp23969_c0_seq6:2309-2512(-)